MPKFKNAPDGERATIDGTEVMPLGSSDASTSWWASLSTFAAYIRTLTQTLTNKTIDLTSNTLTGTTAQFNTALSDGNFATLAGTEALTGKTIDLASNTLTGTKAQFNTALSDADFATLTGSETLTNKTLTSPTITGTTNPAVYEGDVVTSDGDIVWT